MQGEKSYHIFIKSGEGQKRERLAAVFCLLIGCRFLIIEDNFIRGSRFTMLKDAAKRITGANEYEFQI